MAVVSITNVVVLDNPTSFSNPFQFEVHFECLESLEDDLEWKVTYVGCAEDPKFDQVLTEVMVGPVAVGTSKFMLQSDPPDHTKIPPNDILGITIVLVTCSYKDKEFVRVGYYVSNEHADPVVTQAVAEGEPVPQPLDMSQITRTIMTDKPRVTRFPIDWDRPAETDKENTAPPLSPASASRLKELQDTEAAGAQDEGLDMGDEGEYDMDDEGDLDMDADEDDMDANIEIDLEEEELGDEESFDDLDEEDMMNDGMESMALDTSAEMQAAPLASS